jgi:hypothetical protein
MAPPTGRPLAHLDDDEFHSMLLQLVAPGGVGVDSVPWAPDAPLAAAGAGEATDGSAHGSADAPCGAHQPQSDAGARACFA